MKAPSKTLIRFLSTGRTATRFMAGVFENQRYRSFHENLYAGEPRVAVNAYMKYLGDLWFNDHKAYFMLESNYPKPYIRTLRHEFGLDKEGQVKPSLWQRLAKRESKETPSDVIIETGHQQTFSTPMLHKAAREMEIQCKYIILHRNPLRTIHAIYQVERHSGYNLRPQSFFRHEGYLDAASIWLNSYRHILDVRKHLGEHLFRILDIETFTWDIYSTREIFNFLELPFNESAFIQHRDAVMNAPIRTAKHDSERNSDLFRDFGFAFDDMQLEQIVSRIRPIFPDLAVSEKAILDDYKRFHQEEKTKLLEVSG